MVKTKKNKNLSKYAKEFGIEIRVFIEILKRKHINYEENNIATANVTNC